LSGCVGGDALRTLVELGAEPLDGARGKASRDDLAQPRVLGSSIISIDSLEA
jgi:hypothetical protein